MEPIQDWDAIKKMEDFKHLTRTDEHLRTIGCSALNKILSRGLYKWHPNVLKNVSVSGSFSEGATVARFFKKNSEFHDELNREIEIDIEFTTIKINSDLKNYVEDIPSKYGFVKIRADTEMFIAANIGWDVSKHRVQEYLPKFCTNGYLQPFKIKKFTLEKAKINDDTDRQKFIELFFSVVYGEKVSEVSTKKNEAVTNASVAADFFVQVKNQNVLFVSYDFVILFEIGWWPDVALEWKNRARKWPTQSIIDDLTNSCFIIAKSTASEKFDAESYTWRYSFSNIERVLISMRSPQQNLIYLIFKAMFYKWIKPISSTQVFSFVVKNIMLKACEDYPPEHQMWNESYESTKEALVYLFFQAYTAFENGKLEYYFINKINIIESVESVIKEKIKVQILSIMNNFETHFFLNVSQVSIVVEDLVEKIKTLDKILSKANSGNYSDFFNLEFLVKNFDFLLNKSNLSLCENLIKSTAENKLKEKVDEEIKIVTAKVEKEVQKITKTIQDEVASFLIGAVAIPEKDSNMLDEIQLMTNKTDNIRKAAKKISNLFR